MAIQRRQRRLRLREPRRGRGVDHALPLRGQFDHHHPPVVGVGLADDQPAVPSLSSRAVIPPLESITLSSKLRRRQPALRGPCRRSVARMSNWPRVRLCFASAVSTLAPGAGPARSPARPLPSGRGSRSGRVVAPGREQVDRSRRVERGVGRVHVRKFNAEYLAVKILDDRGISRLASATRAQWPSPYARSEP